MVLRARSDTRLLRGNQATAVACQRKLQHTAKVDARKVHGPNVAQQVRIDTPHPGVVPRVQDPLDVVRHPRHHHVGQSRQRTGDRHQFLPAPAACGGDAPKGDGSDIHVMLALRRSSRQVVVADEELDRTNMVGKLLRK